MLVGAGIGAKKSFTPVNHAAKLSGMLVELFHQSFVKKLVLFTSNYIFQVLTHVPFHGDQD